MPSKMQMAQVAAPESNATSTLQSKFSNKGFTSPPLAAAHSLACGGEGRQKGFTALPLAAAYFNSMPETGYVRTPVVLALFGISRPTLYRWIKLSRIPAPKTIGRSSLFQVGQLRACLEGIQSSGQTRSTEGGE